ncbi:hypothetical protein [Adhaeribacter swui]|uniref:hypothetical protein n=1 Tax=Adhaeribacter swui TaxID=2086471 RepID=UPI0016238D60|nr:hypothetical protein [Adhaeribacter swui]
MVAQPASCNKSNNSATIGLIWYKSWCWPACEWQQASINGLRTGGKHSLSTAVNLAHQTYPTGINFHI